MVVAFAVTALVVLVIYILDKIWAKIHGVKPDSEFDTE
jgi:hypothetical protein